MNPEEVFAALATNADGLSAVEAGARQTEFGANVIPERERLTHLAIIARQLESPLILVLIFAGGLTILLGEFVETGVIFAAVAVNTALGFWQEHKAETVLALLETYVRTRARVRRQNREREVDAQELVPGDIIRISQGDRVPADARLFFGNNLELDEAVLTGESLPVVKDTRVLLPTTELPDRTAMVFSGTLVTQGFGDAVVTATGASSEFGKIASLVVERERESTPLQRSLARFSRSAGAVLGALTIGLFTLGLQAGYGISEMFLIAVAVAVSAVPEGLPVAVTVILAIGVQRLAARQAVIRRLLAAETLGRTTIILTDKTGTLTQARMEISAVLPAAPAFDERELFRVALLHTDAIVENPQEPPEEWRMFGRPLEVALVRGAARSGVFLPKLREEVAVLERLPFDSARKFSIAITRWGNRLRLSLLGAPEILLGFSKLLPEEMARYGALIQERAFSGERVLGVALTDLDADAPLPGIAGPFRNLDFAGLISLRDPLRREVAGAIASIAAAGVRTVIVTGDHAGTAEAVARELGMVDGKGAVLTSNDLKTLRPEELAARAGQVAVYARVTPEEKLRLVKFYRERGEVVAVTGDGVNDAPALQAADIGVAVGSGTDVAKAAADLVILDDNFGTITAAIEEGRNILSNIRKVVVYLLSGVFDELFLIGGALIAGVPLPLSALQILFVNFFSDSFPAVALAFERGIDGLRRPQGKEVFDRTVRFLILVIGIPTSLLLFVLYYVLLAIGLPGELVRTFIFAAFATYTLFLAFSVRSFERPIFSYSPFSNRYLLWGVAIGLSLTLAVIYLPPLQEVFGTVALPPLWLLAVLAVGAANIVAVEFGKWLFRHHGSASVKHHA